jgi:hypothetical protein
MMMKNCFHLLFLFLACFSCRIAMAIEEPRYEVLVSDASFEIRRYAPMLVAETFAEGDMDQASNKGFRFIADYIFGNNQVPGSAQKSKIAMTAPVTVEPQSSVIAMTAPVSMEPQSADLRLDSAQRWRVHFVMPSIYTLENIPKPRNDAVRLRQIPSKYFVVYKYSWLNSHARVQQKTQAVLEWAQQRSLQVLGTPQLARYDPPWTPPMFRRNEIMVEIAQP